MHVSMRPTVDRGFRFGGLGVECLLFMSALMLSEEEHRCGRTRNISGVLVLHKETRQSLCGHSGMMVQDCCYWTTWPIAQKP